VALVLTLSRDEEQLVRLSGEVAELRREVASQGRAIFASWRPWIRRRAFLSGAFNLACYVALRRHDLRDLQERLMPLGLSSLGRCESRVLPTLQALERSLAACCPQPSNARYPGSARFFRGERILARNTAELLNPPAGKRNVRIMVTLDGALQPERIQSLVSAGMDCARINTAHDRADVWHALVRKVRAAAAQTPRSCKICADLGGPRMRIETVRLAPGRQRVVVGDVIQLAARADMAQPGGGFFASCSMPELIPQMQAGERVSIDEGRIGCVITARSADALTLRVCAARETGEKLKPQKGLNFPDARPIVESLTAADLAALDELADEVDMFGLSFVGSASDVERLHAEIARRRDPRLAPCGIVLKIETALGLHNLPEIIVRSAGLAPTAVMIARGDLAIEIGYQRLAEVQEELLWLCEAASVPVIWATEVLDGFVKKGRLRRAEFTDAAMAERADCVMLNKGEYVEEAVGILDDVLGRMQGHQTKKTSRLRALHSW
jgi:pyruvate kinase